MPVYRKGNRFVPDPAPMLPVPIGDPIDMSSNRWIHRVVCYVEADGFPLPSGGYTENRQLAITACGRETGRLRQHYPTRGEPCPKCWPNGICCPTKGPRLLVDRTEWYRRNPF